MYDVNSPILDFYPAEFEQDLNGKKQEWEAVVKIPFIEEQRLLKAMGCEYVYIIPKTSAHDPHSTGTPPNQGGATEERVWHINQIHLQSRRADGISILVTRFLPNVASLHVSYGTF